MYVEQYELNNADACASKRNFEFALKEELNSKAYVKKVGIIKNVIRKCVGKEMPMEDVDEALREGFKDVDYICEEQREIHNKDAMRQISRIVKSLANDKTLMRAIPADVDAGCGLTVHTVPDYIRIDEDSIEVAKIKCSKPHLTQKNAMSNLELYTLFLYGKLLVPPGRKKTITASFWYLGKNNDSWSQEKPNFDEDFFNNKGAGNIVSITGDYENKASVDCAMDLYHRGQVEKFVTAIPKEECSEQDCEKCILKEICAFVEAPFSFTKDATMKSLSALNLSSEQEHIIEFENGVMSVNAGAGSGKTTVLTIRVATLINKGADPAKILLVSYTNAAAKEMKDRIKLMLEDFGIEVNADDMYIMTLHAFGNMILQDVYADFGFTSPPVLIDDLERNRFIADIISKTIVPGLDYRNMNSNNKNCMGALAVASKVFSVVKEGQYSVSDWEKVFEEIGDYGRFGVTRETVTLLIGLYDVYEEKLRSENLIDYSDMEVLLHEHLHKDPFYLEKYGFEHIMVDEFQDTNAGQIEILRNLMGLKCFKSLMTVGDDSQGIYASLRGTSTEFIENPEETFGTKVEVVNLVENHRSTPEILEAANKVNAMRNHRVEKDLIATREHGVPVIVEGFLTKPEEIAYVIESIKKHLDAGAAPEDICVIAATKYELLCIADALGKEGIASVLLVPEPLAENSRVIAAISLCTAINNPQDTKDRLVYANAKANGGLLTAKKAEIEAAIEEVSAEIEAYHTLESDADKKEKLIELFKAIDKNEDEVYESFIEKLETKPVTSKIFDYCKDFYRFGSNTAYRRSGNYPGIALTTAHSSKGLEWPIVFNMVSKYDGEPFHHNTTKSWEMVEERLRLLFVSMTRARDELIITGQYVSHGKRGDYTYNQFLRAAYISVGKDFTAVEVEQLRKKREDEKKLQKKLEKEKQKEAEAAPPL